jgi:uncharacterized membrane protein
MRVKKSPHYFLSKSERKRVVAAIHAAEHGTSGEIRVHVERKCPVEPLDRARVVFDTLGMTGTQNRNGVLIYIALSDRVFAIYGDQGIDDAVQRPFWNEIRDRMQERFKAGEFCAGICEAVTQVGAVLHSCFPAVAGDVNELPDEPSFDLS